MTFRGKEYSNVRVSMRRNRRRNDNRRCTALCVVQYVVDVGHYAPMFRNVERRVRWIKASQGAWTSLERLFPTNHLCCVYAKFMALAPMPTCSEFSTRASFPSKFRSPAFTIKASMTSSHLTDGKTFVSFFLFFLPN